MKNMFQKAALLLGVFIFTFSACKKETIQEIASYNAETDVTALAEQAANAVDEIDVIAEDPDMGSMEMGIYMENDGIAHDFMVEEGDMENEGPAGLDDRNRIRSLSFMACLRKLELSDTQKIKVKRALAAYHNCKMDAIKRARAIHAKVHAEFKAKFDRLVAAYKNGDITKEQFKKATEELKTAFRKRMRELQLQEKLDDALKGCYKDFLRHLNNILGERQWKAFVACHKR